MGTLVKSLRGQKLSQGDCCAYCHNTTSCNVWTWCPSFEVSHTFCLQYATCPALPVQKASHLALPDAHLLYLYAASVEPLTACLSCCCTLHLCCAVA